MRLPSLKEKRGESRDLSTRHNMKQYLYDYINQIDLILKGEIESTITIQEHLVKIQFFQHERQIHLFVTLTYSFFFFISLILSVWVPIFRFVSLILCLFLIPYVLHYFRMEKGVQYLYRQYDMLKEL